MAVSHSLAVLFCDISDSSRLYRELGDREASALVRGLLDELARIVEGCGGRVVDRIGDELFCTLPEPGAAASVAVDLQRSACIFGEQRSPGRYLAVRIGLHGGPVLEEGGRVFGDTVYLAKRLADAAKPQQILLTDRVLKAAAASGWSARFVETVTLKGQATATDIHEILWDDLNSNTQPLRPPGTGSPRVARGRLILEGAEARRAVDPGLSITLGRSTNCDLYVPATPVSRVHAVVEGQGERFLLRDVSTNGSFVQMPAGGDARFLRRDEIVLENSGLIGLGERPDAQATHTLRFRIEEIEDA